MTLRCAVLLLAGFGVQASPPNQRCCSNQECRDIPNGPLALVNNRMKCPNEQDGGCGFDNCVGGTGVDCEGVQQDINLGVATIKANIVRPIPAGPGRVLLKVSVGSILHDLCCIQHPHGAFCDGSNYPIGATVNPFGQTNNNCACLMEWRKAAWNLIRGRVWPHSFSTAARSSNLTPRPDVQRRSYLPKAWNAAYTSSKQTWGITEVQATADLCAPSGTHLDCPSEDNNCKVPCFGTRCIARESGGTRAQRRRWNKGRSHSTAGDSEYCCSRKFKEVYWALPSTRYGVCK